MRYDDIFEKPIEEYTDDEIRERAMEMRKNAKLTRRGNKKKKDDEFVTEAETNDGGIKKDKAATMLEQMMNNAKKTAERDN